MLAITSTIIKTTAAIMFPFNSFTIRLAYIVSSLVITISKFFGRVFSKSNNTSLIALEASIALALSRKEISKVTASCPLTLA